MGFHTLVPLPPLTDINSGLSAADHATMMGMFGKPGRLTRECSPITNGALLRRMVTRSVGPFKVSGLDAAVSSLERVFSGVKIYNRALYDVVETAGMLCCRAVRDSHEHYSNHSWGTAIDLEIQSQLDQLGADMVQQGILDLYPYFHKEGWFWGAGYHGRKDPMHFEVAPETLRKWGF